MKIDTHAHIFLSSLTMAKDSRYRPNYDASFDMYKQNLETHGFDGGVLVQPSFLGTDNEFMLDSIKGSNIKAIVVVSPNISLSDLESLKIRGACGIRLNLLGKEIPDFTSLDYQRLFTNVRKLGMQVEIQRDMRDLHVALAQIVDYGCDIMIDHLGRGDSAHSGLQELLRFIGHKIYFKVSGFYRAGVDSAASIDFAREMYDILRDRFGLENFVFGSDFPFTNFESSVNYDSVMRAFYQIVQSPYDRERILGENAERIFGF